MMRYLSIVLLCGTAFAACPDAGNSAGYVRAAAGGTASGADWTNAFTDLPASLVRGCTYYVAGGSYAAHQFNDADSGTTLITVQAATIASHGTATGWNNAYQAQATFQAALKFYTDYYTLNGVYRTSNGTPWVDWNNAPGYGFAINNAAGGGNAYDSVAAVYFGNADQGGGIAVHDITFEYVDINGSHSTNSDVVFDWGIWSSGVLSGTQNNNIYVGYVHVHNTGTNELVVDGNTNFTCEYSWFELMNQNNTAGKSHSETIDWRGNGTNPTSHAIFRYNFVEGGGGTAFFATTNGAGAATNWYIYGNAFFDNPSEETENPTSGNGIFSPGYGYASMTNLYFVNNSISSINSGGVCGLSTDNTATYTNYVVEDNVWYNCAQNNGIATNANTWDYNEYYTAPTMASNDGSAHAINGGNSTNPFVDVANQKDADNFNLVSHTTAGVTISNQPPGCTVNCIGTDMNGVTGTDRGALNLTGPATPAFTPNGGTFTANPSVTITCGGGATCCYTTNGGTPTAGTPGTCDQSTYSTPITIPSTLTLKAIGTEVGFSNSSVQSALFTMIPLISPGSLSFGNQTVNTTSAGQTITFTNNTGATITWTSVLLTTGTQFSIFSNTCTGTLTTANSCTTVIKFTPTTAGAKSDTLTYTDSDASSPQTVALSGTGVAGGTNNAVTMTRGVTATQGVSIVQ